ncbi:MAG: hypothetical protein KJZ83_19900 [Burkholderiaceae bacterium]|nr:hypothetical protein [Burkholderiaceae bacterium]
MSFARFYRRYGACRSRTRRRSRLHDRPAYTLVEGAWTRTRLSP